MRSAERAALAVAVWLSAGSISHAAPDAGTPALPDRVTIDLARTPVRSSGAVHRYKAQDATHARFDVHLIGSMMQPPGKIGELLYDLRGTDLATRDYGNASEWQTEVRVSPELVGDGKRNWQRSHRARLFLEDARGRRLSLPNQAIVDRPKSRDGWLVLQGRPSIEVPTPLGFADPGFDPAQVTRVGLNVEAFAREGEVVDGSIEMRELRVRFFPRVPTAGLLPSDARVLKSEPERAARLLQRLTERCHVRPGGMAVGVNLAWPVAKSPKGEDLQLYGRMLDGGGTRWYGKLWDLGEEAVQQSIRADFRGIVATFGAGAVVRIWLFADARGGIGFDSAGMPVGATERARTNLRRLLDLAGEERVVLIPVLLDFGIADGVSRSGPDGSWEASERPELFTDPMARSKLVRIFEGLVRDNAGHPAVLAWEPMNEPENAAALVTPAHFASLQRFVADTVDAIHRAGELATVGHRNAIDPISYARGRIASDLGQAHHYPFLETRPNPSPFGTSFKAQFGPLPAGWGELQAQPGQIAKQLRTAHAAGHRLFLFWSWRGHEPTGDGFAVQPYAAEIRKALASGAAGPRPPQIKPRP